MATMTGPTSSVSTAKPSHDYHAEAHVLSGQLKHPIQQKIEHQVPVKLNDRRGGHLTRYAEDVSVEGLISFTRGRTRVSGARSLKNDGWITLSTSILEGLNVFEIITADRVVSQVSTDHAYLNGHVPHVTFLGTQFTNLKIGGFKPTLTLNLGICGDIPAGEKSYLQDETFLEAVKAQTAAIAHAKGLPADLKKQYDGKLTYIDSLIDTRNADDKVCHEPITCSLVQSISFGDIPLPIPGLQIFGHILVIPEFGSVALGEIKVGERKYEEDEQKKREERPSSYFELTSIRMEMGCVAAGTASAGTTTANGRHYP
jgi:hypothetical protein